MPICLGKSRVAGRPWLLLAMVLSTLPAGNALCQLTRVGANLAVNASFEERVEGGKLPKRWWGDTAVYGIDTDVKHSGQASLRYVNTDPKRYRLAAQNAPLRAGLKYRFSVWVKTDKLVGGESGATICVEWSDKKDNWMGGCYPAGVKGTTDWTRIEGVARIPAEAKSCGLRCYVRKGMTGRAWFDDVEIVRVADPPMRTVLLAPLYRGRIDADGPAAARVRARLNLVDYPDLKSGDVRVRGELRDESGGVVGREVAGRPAGDPPSVDLDFATGGLKVGKYELFVRLVGPAGKVLQTARHGLTRVADDFHARCMIDRHRRLLVDGKPFFPLGMYWSSINEKDIKLYAQSKFNCLMPYGSPRREQMDLAGRHGLKVIYSVKDWYHGSRWCPGFIKSEADEERLIRRRVSEFRDHPALLAWYLNDELSQSFMPQLEAHQRWVADEDPDHPTWVVLYQYRQVAAYLKTFDVIGTDPYPIGRGPASMAAGWTAETFWQVEGARPMWQVPQLHNWANYAKTESEKKRGRTPTHDEVRSMAWQCICEGATGLVFYSWYDMKRNPDVSFDVQWNRLKRLAVEIDRMTPVLLSVEPVPALTVAGTPPRWLHWLARMQAGRLYLVAVNDGDGQGKVVFNLPATPTRVRELGENRSIQPEGSVLQAEMPRLAVRCYEIEFASK